jgi:hypothetical protein
MKEAPDRSRSFILRIWVERRDIKDAPLIWRGEIEDVRDQKRYWFQDFEKMVAIVRPFVENLLRQVGER